VIEQSTVLEELDLGDNKLTLSDGKFANAIAKNKTLKEISVYNNRISIEGAKHLAEALKENKTLEVLYLGDNYIGDEGAKYIAEMLIVKKNITKDKFEQHQYQRQAKSRCFSCSKHGYTGCMAE